MDIREKILKIRAKQIELDRTHPTGVVMVSVQSDAFNTVGGLTMEIPTDSAARHLVEGTHRIATDAEVEAFRSNQGVIRQSIQSAELARQKVTVISSKVVQK